MSLDQECYLLAIEPVEGGGFRASMSLQRHSNEPGYIQPRGEGYGETAAEAATVAVAETVSDPGHHPYQTA